jgi:hypothetical protein
LGKRDATDAARRRKEHCRQRVECVPKYH